MSDKLSDIRRQIDSLDQKLHELIMKRADLACQIGEEKRKNDMQVVQPDREAVMIRRLLDRHKGPLPKEAIVRVWRELVGAVSMLQTDLRVVVTVPEDASGLIYWDMAKDYFSSVLPMQKATNPLGALAMVREGEASFAVLPWPVDGDENAWWSYLIGETGDKPMRIMARLPLGGNGETDRNPEYQALVVARFGFESSGDDHSFIALIVDQDISRARIVDRAKEAGMTPMSMYSARARDGLTTVHLIEVNDYVGAGDSRLEALLSKLDTQEGTIAALGGYARLPAYELRENRGPVLKAEPRDKKTA